MEQETYESYSPLSHDYQGTSSLGKHQSCVLCGSSEDRHLNDEKVIKKKMMKELIKDISDVDCSSDDNYYHECVADDLIRKGWRKVSN